MLKKLNWLINIKVKEIIFIVILILCGGGIGILCGDVSHQYETLFFPFSQAMKSAAWLIGMLILISVAIAVVSALLRPKRLLILGHMLGALAFFLTWRHGAVSFISALIYFLGIAYYAYILTIELDGRLEFSLRPLSYEHRKLFMIMSLMLSISFAWGYKLSVAHDPLRIPQSFKDSAQEMMLSGLKSQVENQPGITKEQQDVYIEQARQSIDNAWTRIEDTIQPYVKFIPIGLVLPLYFLLLNLLDTLWMIPYLLTWIVFSILTKVGVTKTIVEVKESKILRL